MGFVTRNEPIFTLLSVFRPHLRYTGELVKVSVIKKDKFWFINLFVDFYIHTHFCLIYIFYNDIT